MSSEELRKHNLGTVLQRLHFNGPATRSELTSVSGLNRSTIADLVGQLSMLGLVTERHGITSAGPGRPSPMVAVKPGGITVLAVEVGVDSIAVATVGLGGHIFNNIRVGRPRGRFSPEETVQDVAKLADPLLAALPTHSYFAGVGVGAAGLIRRSDGNVRLSPNLSWHDVPFGNLVADALGLSEPVLVINEADAGAVAEHSRGVAPGTENLIYVSGEVGLGTGIILNGQLLRGSAGYGGESGHTLINPRGIQCRCGAIGCLETEAGESALLRHAGMAPNITGTSVLDDLTVRAANGDSEVLGAIGEIGHWLGLGIGNLINIFNPELVVLGGLYFRLYEFLEKAVLTGVEAQVLDAPYDQTRIAPTRLGVDAHLIGAAEMVLQKVIADPTSFGEPAGESGMRSTD